MSVCTGTGLGSAGPNYWEQFRSAQVPSELAIRSVEFGARAPFGSNWSNWLKAGPGWLYGCCCFCFFSIDPGNTLNFLCFDSARRRISRNANPPRPPKQKKEKKNNNKKNKQQTNNKTKQKQKQQTKTTNTKQNKTKQQH